MLLGENGQSHILESQEQFWKGQPIKGFNEHVFTVNTCKNDASNQTESTYKRPLCFGKRTRLNDGNMDLLLSLLCISIECNRKNSACAPSFSRRVVPSTKIWRGVAISQVVIPSALMHSYSDEIHLEYLFLTTWHLEFRSLWHSVKLLGPQRKELSAKSSSGQSSQVEINHYVVYSILVSSETSLYLSICRTSKHTKK